MANLKNTRQLTPSSVLPVFLHDNKAPGTYVQKMALNAETVLVTFFVETVTSGTVKLKVYTYSDPMQESEEALIVEFPEITSPSTELLLRKSAIASGWLRFEVEHNGTASYKVYAKGLSLGETNARILSAEGGEASQLTVGTSTQPIVNSTLTDRTGLIIKNYGGPGVLFIGYSPAEATPQTGYPLASGESMGMDVAAGVVVYGVGSTSIDVRILQNGT